MLYRIRYRDPRFVLEQERIIRAISLEEAQQLFEWKVDVDHYTIEPIDPKCPDCGA